MNKVDTSRAVVGRVGRVCVWIEDNNVINRAAASPSQCITWNKINFPLGLDVASRSRISISASQRSHYIDLTNWMAIRHFNLNSLVPFAIAFGLHFCASEMPAIACAHVYGLNQPRPVVSFAHSFRMGIAFSALNESLTRHSLRSRRRIMSIQQGVKYTYDVAMRFAAHTLTDNCISSKPVEKLLHMLRSSDRLIFHKFNFSACLRYCNTISFQYSIRCGAIEV